MVTSTSSPKPTSEQLIEKFGRLNVLDDLIRLRAADATQRPILAYPALDNDAVSYEYFTGQDLDRTIDRAVQALMDYGFAPPQDEKSTVALFTLSDLNMLITLFALSRLGYTVMMLSPRLSAEACVSLLDAVGCDTILYGQAPSMRATLGEILRLKVVTCRPITEKSSLNEYQNATVLVLNRNRNPEAQSNRTAVILHSSGSTGTPIPLSLSHKALLTHPLRGPGFTAFNSLPWYHLHGLSTALQAMWMRKIAFMWDASQPLTASVLVAAIEAAQPESVHAVPYVLQLLVDSTRGLELLRTCKLVAYGGAPCPDELGDRFVNEGVKFGGSLGLTEAGLVAESISRPADDPFWNYLRFFDAVRPFVWMKPVGDSLYECVYLSGHPTLSTSNSDEPPGSFHSQDVFAPHPTIPDRWKYVTRLDDRITLVNGEKVLPLPIEGRIKQHPLIDEAVVVGVGKAAPGLLIFRSDEAKRLSDKELLDTIWPSIEDANSRAETWHDKGSMIRDEVYRQYADEIDGLYTVVKRSRDSLLELSVSGTKAYLMKACSEDLGLPISSPDADLYTEGVDSLKAIHLRRFIIRDFKLADDTKIGQNIVFETGTISNLAERVHALQTGGPAPVEDELSLMSKLIEKYSTFGKHTPGPTPAGIKKSVIITGATGSIGSHTLHELLQDPSISAIYCFTRREHPMPAVLDTLAKKRLHITLSQRQKIVALTTSLPDPNFSLTDDQLNEMRESVFLIINTAWPVNFNIGLSSFGPLIKGLRNLIAFSLSVHLPAPAALLSCSSVSAALGSPSPEIPETPMLHSTDALDMGYGRSKFVGERIVSNAQKAGAKAYSLRIGQVSGHSKNGLWNDSEALPLMVRSCLTLNALPELTKTCAWIPVDKLASMILEIGDVCSSITPKPTSTLSEQEVDNSVYNLVNPHSFPWPSLLTGLRDNGFNFETVGFNTWISLLRDSEERGEVHVNPAVKLIDSFESMYGQHDPARPTENQKWSKAFVTERAERDSSTLGNRGVRIIEDGILKCYAADWLRRWMG